MKTPQPRQGSQPSLNRQQTPMQQVGNMQNRLASGQGDPTRIQNRINFLGNHNPSVNNTGVNPASAQGMQVQNQLHQPLGQAPIGAGFNPGQQMDPGFHPNFPQQMPYQPWKAPMENGGNNTGIDPNSPQGMQMQNQLNQPQGQSPQVLRQQLNQATAQMYPQNNGTRFY